VRSIAERREKKKDVGKENGDKRVDGGMERVKENRTI